MIKAIAKFIVALNGNVKKTQIAAGFSWGLLLALLPVGNIFWIVLFICSFFFKHHHGAKLLVTVLFKLFSPLLAIPLDVLGWEFLHIAALEPFFTRMYNTPFVLFTRFNNTLVAGGLLTGLALFLPVFLLVSALIPVYRNTLLPRMLNTKFFKAIANVPLVVKIAQTVQALGGDLEGLHG